MSTNLELCKALRRETDMNGTGPDSVTSQSGDLLDIVEWIQGAWTRIQNDGASGGGRWRWLRRKFTFVTAADDGGSYASGVITDVDANVVIDRFASWRINDLEDPPKIRLTSAGLGGQRWLVSVPWEWWKQIYDIGLQTTGPPQHICEDPQQNIRLGPEPNDIYTVDGEFYRSAQIFADAANPGAAIPEMPKQFHDYIMWTALDDYGYKNVAPEALARAQVRRRQLRSQLNVNQMDRFKRAPPMA